MFYQKNPKEVPFFVPEMRGGRFPDSSTYCLDFSMGGRNSQTIAFSQLSKALCHKRFSPDATF